MESVENNIKIENNIIKWKQGLILDGYEQGEIISFLYNKLLELSKGG